MSDVTLLETIPAGSTGRLAIFADPNFRRILRVAQDHGLVREEFSSMPLPEGYRADEVWNALLDVRRAQATYFRDTWRLYDRDAPQWYTMTTTMRLLLQDFDVRARTGSPLDLTIRDRDARTFMVKSLADEAAAAALCDSMFIDYESARSVIVGQREPHTPGERLAQNMSDVLFELRVGSVHEITPAYIEALYERLMEGVDADAFTLDIPWGDEWPMDPMDHENALREICGLADGTLNDRSDHPILIAQKIGCKCWKNACFPHCNYAIGSLLGRIYLIAMGYPVFAYIPTSSLTLEWKKGTYSNPDVYPYSHVSILDVPDRIDLLLGIMPQAHPHRPGRNRSLRHHGEGGRRHDCRGNSSRCELEPSAGIGAAFGDSPSW